MKLNHLLLVIITVLIAVTIGFYLGQNTNNISIVSQETKDSPIVTNKVANNTSQTTERPMDITIKNKTKSFEKLPGSSTNYSELYLKNIKSDNESLVYSTEVDKLDNYNGYVIVNASLSPDGKTIAMLTGFDGGCAQDPCLKGILEILDLNSKVIKSYELPKDVMQGSSIDVRDPRVIDEIRWENNNTVRLINLWGDATITADVVVD